MIPTTIKDPAAWLGRKTWRTTTARKSRTCRAVVVEGLDADRCAITVRVDPIPLTALGEAIALLDGIPTYTAHRGRTRAVQLTRRSGHWPATIQTTHDVWPAHKCGHTHTHTTHTTLSHPGGQP